MKMSETISELALALSKAQGQIEDATKDGINPAFKSKYADLSAYRAVIREPLAVNDLASLDRRRLFRLGLSLTERCLDLCALLLNDPRGGRIGLCIVTCEEAGERSLYILLQRCLSFGFQARPGFSLAESRGLHSKISSMNSKYALTSAGETQAHSSPL